MGIELHAKAGVPVLHAAHNRLDALLEFRLPLGARDWEEKKMTPARAKIRQAKHMSVSAVEDARKGSYLIAPQGCKAGDRIPVCAI